jgi:hypothetical protein
MITITFYQSLEKSKNLLKTLKVRLCKTKIEE